MNTQVLVLYTGFSGDWKPWEILGKIRELNLKSGKAWKASGDIWGIFYGQEIFHIHFVFAGKYAR